MVVPEYRSTVVVPVSGSERDQKVARQAVPNTPPFEVKLTTLRVSLDVGYGTHHIAPSGSRCAR